MSLPEDGGSVRVIAGEFAGAKGPARTVTPINLLDVRLRAGHRVQLSLRDGYTAALFILKGKVVVNGESRGRRRARRVRPRRRRGRDRGDTDATVFVMNGQPIDEPIAGYGPFVMNTPQQIQQAIADLRTGRLGQIPALTA